ncbi:MAG: hypothetical protein IPM47_08745 [Sphingobacteriales bacterium]|nr:MAG: hypothetical protein IPM47_08745 [Sphingobacteriales bacterium]
MFKTSWFCQNYKDWHIALANEGDNRHTFFEKGLAYNGNLYPNPAQNTLTFAINNVLTPFSDNLAAVCWCSGFYRN